MKRLLTLLAILLSSLLCMTLCAIAQKAPCGDPCGTLTSWDDFNVFELQTTVPNTPGYASYRGKFDKKSFDIQLDLESSDGKKLTKGKVLMIGGRIMATQGPVTEPGYEIDAIDGPVLELKLVMRLLGESAPAGPGPLGKAQKLDFKNDSTGIQFATPSAQGYIAPPWHATGEIRTIAKDIVDYELHLTSRNSASVQGQGVDYRRNFVGRLSRTDNARIDDSMSLAAWNIFGLGVQTRKEDGGVIYDFGAKPEAKSYNTVADIRRRVAEEDYPGEPDPTKNFTGFWKEKCEDAFGLQILRHGTDGKYTVGFCGPGGCDNPDEESPTFITKDPHYEVISESQIRTGSVTYHKCTNDPHPVLKYKEDQ